MPVLVRNNVRGTELEVLKRFREPTWANPSVRLVDPADEKTLARVAGAYDAASLRRAIVSGLRAAERPVPTWFALHVEEGPRERAVFAMHCFWQGEAGLGRLDGVVASRTGWLGGSEVVELEFLSARLPFGELAARALQSGAADGVVCRSDAQHAALPGELGARATRDGGAIRYTPGDDKKRLQGTPLRHLPLSPAQATRINALGNAAAGELLSPRQRALLELIRAHPQACWPEALGVELERAFAGAEAVARTLEAKR